MTMSMMITNQVLLLLLLSDTLHLSQQLQGQAVQQVSVRHQHLQTCRPSACRCYGRRCPSPAAAAAATSVTATAAAGSSAAAAAAAGGLLQQLHDSGQGSTTRSQGCSTLRRQPGVALNSPAPGEQPVQRVVWAFGFGALGGSDVARSGVSQGCRSTIYKCPHPHWASLRAIPPPPAHLTIHNGALCHT